MHFFVNLDIWAFGANGLSIRIGEKVSHSMVVYASGGPINNGLLCEVVRQFFLVVAIEKLMTGDGAWSLGIQARRLKPGMLRRGGCRSGAQKGPDTNGEPLRSWATTG